MNLVQKVGEGTLPHWSKWTQNPEERLRIVSTFSPSDFLYQSVSLELQSLESSLPPPRQQVNILGVSLAPVREVLPGQGPLLPCRTVSSSALADFWPLSKLFKVIAVNFQSVGNTFLTCVGLSH